MSPTVNHRFPFSIDCQHYDQNLTFAGQFLNQRLHDCKIYFHCGKAAPPYWVKTSITHHLKLEWVTLNPTSICKLGLVQDLDFCKLASRLKFKYGAVPNPFDLEQLFWRRRIIGDGCEIVSARCSAN